MQKPIHDENNKIAADIFNIEAPDNNARKMLVKAQKRIELKTNFTENSPSMSSPAIKHNIKVNLQNNYEFQNIVADVKIDTEDLKSLDSLSPDSSAGLSNETSGPTFNKNSRGVGRGFDGVGRGTHGTGYGIGSVISEVGAADLGGLGIGDSNKGIGLFGTGAEPGHGLVAKVYVTGGLIRIMPNFSKLDPIKIFITPNLDVERRYYTDGFPISNGEIVIEDFAVNFKCKLAILKSGVHMFELISDDGSKLYINGKIVINNDGIHDVISKKSFLNLNKGFHDVEVQYFQGPRIHLALQWFYQAPGEERKIVPPEVIFHPNKETDMRMLNDLILK